MPEQEDHQNAACDGGHGIDVLDEDIGDPVCHHIPDGSMKPGEWQARYMKHFMEGLPGGAAAGLQFYGPFCSRLSSRGLASVFPYCLADLFSVAAACCLRCPARCAGTGAAGCRDRL